MSKDDFKNIDSLEKLLNLQKTFASIIRKPLTDNHIMQEDFRTDEMIAPNESFSAHQRLQFYSRQYWWRIQGAFDEDFLSVKKLAGDKRYLELRNEYLKNYPSTSYTLRNLGSRFPEFLKSIDTLYYDAACFDWARIESFDSASKASLTVNDFEDSGFSSKTLVLQPYVKLLSLSYPIQKIKKDINKKLREQSSNVLSGEDGVEETKKHELNKEETFLAIHRLDSRIYSKELNSAQYAILSAFKEGLSLDGLQEFVDANNIEFDLQDFFKELMALNWLCVD